ncbi:adenine phosphoribosyltransferase 1 [Quercus suber]|uniref:adenine phosphoribosyltransferase n=1 Tax=Quercus suber TaxID=58331 RepID=A0AAW0M6S2_QUESU
MEIMHKASSSLSCKISFFPSPDNIDSPRTLATPFRHSSASSNSQQLQLQLNRSKNHRPALSPLRCTASDSVKRQEMAGKDGQDPRIQKISSAIRVIPDFPKPGIMFQDITTLLLDTKAFRDTIDLFVERYKDKNISVVAETMQVLKLEVLSLPSIALAIGAKFVPMRKPNKLPFDALAGEVISEEYSLEYGTDKMEMHVGAVEAGERALIIDDLIATGGTLCAAIRLLERVGVHVVECACVIELPELKMNFESAPVMIWKTGCASSVSGRERLGEKPLFVLVNGA